VHSSGSSFEAFFRANYKSLLRSLAASADDVEDAVQEAFLQAHVHWSKVSGFENPTAWVRLVAVRRILNRDRGRSRKDQAIERMDIPINLAEGSEESLSNSELVKEIWGLPPRQRMSIVLFYLCDLPVTEVASTMGISSGAVKATLVAARKSLRLSLENDDDA